MGHPDRYAATARAAARAVLDAPPFVVRHAPPGALTALVDDLGHGVAAAVRWLGDQLRRLLFHPVDHTAHVAFGPLANVVLIVAAALLVGLLTLAWLRRSRPADRAEPGARGGARAHRAAALLDRANAARRAGDLDHALRLRFEAGLEHLEDRGVLESRASLTTGAVAARLASPTFDELAARHALVAYAGVPASADDVDDAFRRWPEVTGPGAGDR